MASAATLRIGFKLHHLALSRLACVYRPRPRVWSFTPCSRFSTQQQPGVSQDELNQSDDDFGPNEARDSFEAHIQSRILPHSNLPDLSSPSFPSYVHPASVAELTNISLALLSQAGLQRQINFLNDSRLVVLTCPHPGSRQYLQDIAKGLAGTLQLDFLSVDQNDFFASNSENSSSSTPNQDDSENPAESLEKLAKHLHDVLSGPASNDAPLRLFARALTKKPHQPKFKVVTLINNEAEDHEPNSEGNLREHNQRRPVYRWLKTNFNRIRKAFDRARSSTDSQGKLLYINDFEYILSSQKLSNTFKKVVMAARDRYKNLLIVVGVETPSGDQLQSAVENLNASDDDDNDDDDHSIYQREFEADMFRYLPGGYTTVTFLPPKDLVALTKWEEDCRKRLASFILERNISHLTHVLRRALIQHDSLSQLKGLDGEDSPNTYSRIIMQAIGMQIKAEGNKGEVFNNFVLKAAYIQAAIDTHLELKRHSMDTNKSSKFDRLHLTFHEKRLLPCIIPPESVNVRFSDIGSLEKQKLTLYELITLPLQRPDIFAKGILKQAVSGVLLFGPPGTGKTMLAKAVAAESGANFLALSASSIMDKYVGEGEKNAKAVFTLARKISPCVIFLDEVDALLQGRVSFSASHTKREVINEMMSEWDGLSSRNEGVIVMAATNRPFDLDDAILRRVPRRLLVDLPDQASRRQIISLLLKDEILDDDISYEILASSTPLYSGSDLKNMCIAAAMNSVRELLTQNGNPAHKKLCKRHFDKALEDVKASLAESSESLRELRKWNELYGEGRQKRRAVVGFEPHPSMVPNKLLENA